MQQKIIYFRDLGKIGYREAWDIQEKYFNEIQDIKVRNRGVSPEEQEPTNNYLFFCEHPPVYTLGKSGSISNLLINEEEMETRGIRFFKTNRGGDITFHGPGQVVGYPVLDLDDFFTDVHKYMRLLEETIIQTMHAYGVSGYRINKLTGVWLDADKPGMERKICAMGVKLSRWITMHGWALNVNTDLDFFKYIIPCGIDDKAVTSLEKELGHPVDTVEVKELLLRNFSTLFEAEIKPLDELKETDK